MNPNSRPGWWNFKYFFVCFHPEKWGRWTHFDDHMFQRGWFNQQIDETVFRCSKYFTSIQLTQEVSSVRGLFWMVLFVTFSGVLFVTSIWGDQKVAWKELVLGMLRFLLKWYLQAISVYIFSEQLHFLATTGWSWTEWNQKSAVRKTLCCNDGPWSKLLSNKVADLSPLHFGKQAATDDTYWSIYIYTLVSRVWLWSRPNLQLCLNPDAIQKTVEHVMTLCVYHQKSHWKSQKTKVSTLISFIPWVFVCCVFFGTNWQ